MGPSHTDYTLFFKYTLYTFSDQKATRAAKKNQLSLSLYIGLYFGPVLHCRFTTDHWIFFINQKYRPLSRHFKNVTINSRCMAIYPIKHGYSNTNQGKVKRAKAMTLTDMTVLLV